MSEIIIFENQEIVIKFNYNIVEDDNYIGLANY
jgi:hypothetical protein